MLAKLQTVAKAPPVAPAGFRYILVQDNILDDSKLRITPGPFSDRKVATTICHFEDLTTLDEQIEFTLCLSMKSPGLLLAMRQEQYRRVISNQALMAKAQAKWAEAYAIIFKALPARPPKVVAPILAVLPPPAVVVHGPPLPNAVLALMAPPAIVVAGGAPADAAVPPCKKAPAVKHVALLVPPLFPPPPKASAVLLDFPSPNEHHAESSALGSATATMHRTLVRTLPNKPKDALGRLVKAKFASPPLPQSPPSSSSTGFSNVAPIHEAEDE
jgi:hypothetical protein